MVKDCAESLIRIKTAALLLPRDLQISQARYIATVIANVTQLYVSRVTFDNGVVEAKSKSVPREN